MDWWRHAQDSLGRSDTPEAPAGRDWFLVWGSVAVLILAQLATPGTVAELAGISAAAGVMVIWGLGARLPVTLVVAVVVPSVVLVVGNQGNLEFAFFFPILVTLYAAWDHGLTVRSGVVLLAALAAPWLAIELLGSSDLIWVPWTVPNVFTFTLGLTLRRQQQLIAQLESAREALADQAVAEERRRIARELHDLAGQSLAAVMLHVTGARHVLQRDPGEAEKALREAEAVGRSSLGQIRATVAALRTDESGTDPALPDLEAVETLVDGYRRAGLQVEAQVDAASGLTGPVATAVHRIVGEALANVARHAQGNQTTVVVTVSDDAVTLTVDDRGRRPPAVESNGFHFGLVGMRERAQALGGELSAGPDGDGWRVSATLPLAPGAALAPPGPQDAGDLRPETP